MNKSLTIAAFAALTANAAKLNAIEDAEMGGAVNVVTAEPADEGTGVVATGTTTTESGSGTEEVVVTNEEG